MGWGSGNLGGGSGGLNFKIVGGTSTPSSPKENTIWVNTERIGSWYFSATQPEGMQEWDVWFPTGTESDFAFNALKKNAVQVYPLSAKQMVSGALVGVIAKSYQNGKWVDWITYLYEIGNQHTDLTGGWGNSGWTCPYSGFATTSPTIDSTGITLKTGAGGDFPTAGTANKIDLSKVKNIWVTVESFYADRPPYIAVNSEKKVWNDSEYPMVARTQITKTGEIPLSVEGIDSGYIVVFGYLGTGGVTLAKITKIRLE